MSTDQTHTRPLRRDAVRNRQLLTDAAREVFAARGLDATLDDVARHAGVGVGTAYRHFANKQELAVAIFADDFEQLVTAAHEALEIEDAWEALVTFIETTVTKHAKDRGLYEVFIGQRGVVEAPTVEMGEEVASLRLALTEPVTQLVERARSAGCVRTDIAATDIAAIFLMMGEAYAMSDTTGTEVWRRYLQLLLDGMRAVDRPQLPCEPLDLDGLDQALATVKAKKGHR